MRSRILVAILGTVTASLILAGLGTLVLDRVAARADTVRELRSQAEGFADLMAPVAARSGVRRPAVTRLIKGFKLQGISFMYIGPGGATFGTPPDDVSPDIIDVPRLEAGETLSGRTGSLAYAVAPSPAGNGTLLAVLTRRVDATPIRAYRWFLLSAVVTLVLGTLVALWVSGALTTPLRRAEQATHRIAAGDLSTRLPDPGAGAELGDLAASINTMAEGLERSRGLERQFLLSVSHDLRTPLTSIRRYAEAIADGTAPDAGAAAGVILTESRRLERLVRDLLDLARLDARQFSLHPQVLAVTEVVTEAAEGFRREAEDAGITLVVDEDPTATPALIDPDRLAQVVANLVENALKYAAASVRVSTVALDGTLAVAVADDGPGIAAADLPHVFERLYVSGHRPLRKESGSGLGLAIARELVAAMGGRVTAESPITSNGGTRVVVELPGGRATTML